MPFSQIFPPSPSPTESIRLFYTSVSLLLGLMILPTIISVSEAAIRAVPRSYYEGGLALGASHERRIFFAVLPAAKRGILASVI